jgi:arsenite-transporting ATPase
MSSLMGGQADGTDDMFAKLESMREVITEVNSQFKDPVRISSITGGMRPQPDITVKKIL